MRCFDLIHLFCFGGFHVIHGHHCMGMSLH